MKFFKNFISPKLKLASKVVKDIFFLIFCLFYDFFNLEYSKLDLLRKKFKKGNFSFFKNYSASKSKESVYDILWSDEFLINDIIWAKNMSHKYELKKYKQSLFKSFFRLFDFKKGFVFNFKALKNNFNILNFLKIVYMSGFKFLWKGVRFWIFPLLVCIIIIYSSLVIRLIPFNKIMFSWICIIMFIYWLVSGFVFFFKKYQFGKYTAAIQRFWRRSYILFWLIEGATFSVFLFFTINASQESFYMFDQINVFKTHLYSWRFFFLKLFPIALLIIITYLLLISLKWNLFTKHSLWLLLLTLFLTYIVWLEFYQFYHVVNFYGNLNWIYDIDDHSWSLELEPRRTRIVNHYIMLLFILKFWHIVFIYGFWIFFVLRCWETQRIRYPLLAANFQNFIILYIFAWVFMYPWFKFFFRKFLDSPYYWFYINNRELFLRVIFNDFKLIYYGLLDYFNFFKLNFLKRFNSYSFYYWSLPNYNNNYEAFRKHLIKNLVKSSLVK